MQHVQTSQVYCTTAKDGPKVDMLVFGALRERTPAQDPFHSISAVIDALLVSESWSLFTHWRSEQNGRLLFLGPRRIKGRRHLHLLATNFCRFPSRAFDRGSGITTTEEG
jgi:hypothetical protein